MNHAREKIDLAYIKKLALKNSTIQTFLLIFWSFFVISCTYEYQYGTERVSKWYQTGTKSVYKGAKKGDKKVPKGFKRAIVRY